MCDQASRDGNQMQRSLEFGRQQENSPSRLERVILHLDLDCFYCQVEHARLNIPTNVPLAVQQWDLLIAVNYAARAAGVSRPASVRDAVSKCPSLRLVHVPTFDSTQPEAGACQYPAMGGENGNALQLDRRTYKASLQPYREASLKVFAVLRRKLAEYGAPFVMEKAGLDEVFFDVSSILDSLMNLRYGTHIHRGRLSDNFTLPPLDLRWDVTTCGRGPIEADVDMSVGSAVDDLRIHLGCEVAAALRQAVFQELKYTVSAGIAHNKTLAKLASACHKPNQQTYVLKAHVKPWMDKVPLRKIRFLGGKMGRRIQNTLGAHNTNDTEALDTDASDNDRDDLNDELEEDGPTETSKESSIITAADLWPLSVEELKERLGDAELAKWAYHIIRGEDNTPVAPRLLTKSFMAAKHMSPPIKEWSALQGWLQLLVIELSGRLSEDYQSNNRWPQSLTIYLQRSAEKMKSRAMDFPFSPDQIPEKNSALTEICFNTLAVENKSSPIFPCNRLALSVGKFRTVLGDTKKRSLTLDAFVTRGVSNPITSTSKDAYSISPKERKKRSLTSFFSPYQKKSTRTTDPATMATCPKCGQEFPDMETSSYQEHLDFHLAVTIQNSWN